MNTRRFAVPGDRQSGMGRVAGAARPWIGLVGLVLLLAAGPLFAGRVQTIDFKGQALQVYVPDRLPPTLSVDGKTLYNGALPRILIADPEVPAVPARIPPPGAARSAGVDSLTAPSAATATFTIEYVAAGGTDLWGEPCYTFPETAKAAFNAAAAVWAGLLQSAVPIRIRTCWANFGAVSTLGYSGGGPMKANFSGAPIANTWYSGSLANALAGTNLSGTSNDMHITYNSNFSWYYGTDGVPPSGQMDLMSVVLHEVGHGLNFTGTADVASGIGSWGGGSSYPNIYDRFAYDNSGTQMINTGAYPNNSVTLGNLLKSNNLYFRGPNAMAANSSLPVKLYAPSTWSDGSSYAHLDYATFAGTVNRLMVYAISSGSSIHDPGSVTIGLLKDLGWPTSSGATSPTATTVAASNLTAAGASLNGTVSSNGGATSITFQYGLSTSYGSTVNATQSPLAAGASGTAVSAAITGLVCNTVYHFRVVALNSAGSTNGGDLSFTTTACPGAFAKSSPANAASGVSTSPTLIWTASSAATGYDYCYDTSNDSACSAWVSAGSNLSVNLSGLTAGTTYYWQVRASNTGGMTYADGAGTAFRSFTTAALAPAVSTGSATVLSATGATLNGTVSSNGSQTTVTFEYGLTTSYGSTATAAQSPLAAGASGSAMSAAVTGLVCNSLYNFRVVAQNAGGTTNGSNQTFSTAACSSPGSFGKSSPANGATGVATSASLAWGASSGATGYEYCIDTSNDGACASWVGVGTAMSASPAGLSGGTSYYWQVRANNAGGSTYADGGSSAFWSFTTTSAVSAPAATTTAASALSASGATLNGTVSSNGASTTVTFQYGLTTSYGSSATAAQSPLAAGVSGIAVSAAITGLVCNTTYNFRVVAQNSSGTTNGSNQVFTTAACSSGVLGSSPTSIGFGGQSVNTTSFPQVVTLSNSGGSTLSVTGMSASSGFGVTSACGTLAPGASCTASVTFTPTGEGAVSGTLTINSSVGPRTVALTGTGEKSLVTHYYQAILGRVPDSGGKAYWESIAATLPTWGASVNETWYAMAMAFYFSGEYLAFGRDNTGFVTDLYRTFFNRAPDSGGLNYWVGVLARGMPREVVLAQFMFSTEFATFTQAIFGSTAARAEVNVVMDFYRGLLARLPDKGGFDYWLGQIRTAQCQGGWAATAVTAVVDSISQQFLTSGEYLGRGRSNGQFVGDLYNAFLRRGGDEAGVAYWVNQLNLGQLTREQERQAFLASPEFSSRVSAVIAQGCLQ